MAGVSGLLTLLLLLLLAGAAAGGGAEVNAGMEVARGRSAFLAREQLRIRTRAGDLCKVEVVLNQPITQRVGRLTPQVFDCDFLPEEVAYRHNGSPLLDSDQVLLRVYRLGPAETRVESVVLRVRVVDRLPRLVDLGSTPLVVPGFYALSNAIDRSVVNIKGRDGAACTVRLLAAAGALTAGRLVREDDGLRRKGGEAAAAGAAHCPGNRSCADGAKEVSYLKTSCQDFLSSGLKYQHLSPPSPDLDHIAITVELRDQESGAPLETESLWLPVRIVGAAPNQPPRAAFMASFILEVDQFVLTPITTATLDAEDPEGPRDGLLFNVSVPPPRGYVTHLDEHTKPVGSFSWSDLHHLKVAYQPPNGSRSERDNFQMEFRAIDASYATSPPIVVDVSIRAAETDAPRVSWNTGLDLLEGQSRAITWAELQIVDRDNIDDVVLVAVDGPAHGRLTVKGAKAFAFAARDLREGHVAYEHSDGESTRDHVVFRISDGRHSSRHKFPVNILPRDDTPPFLVNNVALEVPEGGALRLRPADLLASDPDSADARILFRVDVPPRAGRLVSRADPRDPGLPVTSFLQRELTQGLIFYQHSGEEIFEDSFEVTLADAHVPPNLSPAYTVSVAVFPVADGLPVEWDGSVRRLTLKETQVAFITRAHLRFTHSEHPQADLTYAITRPCHSPRYPGLMDAGRLFFVDGAAALRRDPTAPALKSFTQHAVDHLKVAYMPPLEDIGPDPLAVRFVFSVSDRRGGGAVADLDFNITVTPVDDQPPEAFSNLLRVEEGGAAFVTDEHVLARDRDTREPDLKVALERPARRGRLELRGRSLRPGDTFTLADLRGLAVRYVHDDSESTEDDVGLRVTDGANAVLLDLQIHVVPVNDEPPQLGAGLRGGLRCPEGGRVQLTADYLLATDRDSEDAELSYMLARRPARGELRRAGLAVDKFSQEDLLRGHVFYVHTGGEIGPAPASDTVTLIISDGDAGRTDGCCPGDAPPVPLHGTLPVYDLNVTLLPVNNKVPSVILGGSMLAVDEGSRACLCGAILGAWDADSPPAELTFHLDAKPLHGFLENVQPTPGYEKSNAGVPIDSFKLDELTSGFINYVQSEHEGAEPTADQLLISVSDGAHHSASTLVRVVINPANDEKPSLHLANFTVKEGGARELTPSLLDAFDLDAPADELTFSLTGAPAHGVLKAGPSHPPDPTSASPTAVASFTLRQLRQGLRVWYAHDDSETLEDRLTLRLSDGVHSLSATAAIGVLPVDDHPPRLLKNAGVEAEPGERRLLSAVVLQAEDADTPPEKLFYLLHAAPRFGRLRLESRTGPTELAAGRNFTQGDVDANRLSYTPRRRDDGDGGGFQCHDSFRFSLSDLEHQSSAHTFSIAISGAHKGDVSVWTGAVRVVSGQRVLLNTDFLRAQDGGGRPDRLVYAVTVAPRHGLLHAAARPGVPLVTFTQMDVAAQRVCYTHDNGQLHRSDAFSFVVSNGERSQAGTVRLSVEAADRIPPTLEVNAGARVRDGGTAVIGAEVLRLSDAQAPASELTFTLSEPPRYGRLLLRGVPLRAAPPAAPVIFTQADVDGRHLAYRHADTAGRRLNDSFRFLPGDGRNRGYLRDGRLRTEPAVFDVHVEHVDRSPPILTTLGRPSEVIRLRDGRWAVSITSKHLRAIDAHSPPDGLQFAIVTPPGFGHLENIHTGGYVRGRFTQRDLQRRSLVFVVPADADVTEDSFVFRLSDPAGNAAPPQTLDLSWSRIELSASCFRTCETAGTLQVQIRRRGKSADPAYVAIQVRDGTAKAGRDFTHSTAGLIQFDPGVDRKTWSIYPDADGLEENDEDFTVMLRDPKNAVLGQRTSARVEIVDPRGGRCDLSKGETAEAPPPSAFATPPSAVTAPPTAEDDAVLDAEVEQFFGESTHPPRGDVPNRRPFAGDDDDDDSPAEPQDQAHPGHTDEQVAGKAGLQVLSEAAKPDHKVWTFHSLTSLRLEEVAAPRAGDATEKHGPRHAPPAGSRKREAESRQRKMGRSPSGRCEVGWTHHGGRCYLAGSSVSSWASAERSCSFFPSNSSLPSVRSRRHLGWLWRFGGEKPFWIGRSEMVATRRGLPSVATADPPSCLLVESSSRWTSGSCDAATRHAFICERRLQS